MSTSHGIGWITSIAGAALLTACGEEPEAPVSETPPDASARSIVCELREFEPPGDEPRVVRSLEFDELDPEDWYASFEDPDVRAVGRPARTALHLAGGERQHLGFRGSFEAGAFSRVAVHLRGSGSFAIEAQWRRAGEVCSRSFDSSRNEGTGEWQVVPLDFPVPGPREEPFDELVVFVLHARGPWHCSGVDLIERSLRHRLPLPGAPEHVAAGDEARLAVGLSTSVPLATTFVAPAGARLELGCAWPAKRREPRGAKLIVDLVWEGGIRRERIDLAGEEAGWRTASLDVSELEGRSVRARFTLKIPGPMARDSLYALEPPRLVVPRPRPATVVLITSDTHRADHLGAIGSGTSPTPWLDGLATRGVLYTDCFSSANSTLPSHAALMTGHHTRDTGVYVNRQALSSNATTLAELFRAAGWRTFAAVSFRGLGAPQNGVVQGFERVSWPRVGMARPAERTHEAVAPWLDSADDEPLFVWLHYFDAHTPYLPPESYERLYYPEERDENDPSLPEPPWKPKGAFKLARDPDWFRAQYKSEVRYLDDSLQELFEHPRLREAIVAFTADHGENLGEHEIWWGHGGLWPESVHVPLILSWPEAPAGTRVEEPVRQIEVGRTLLSLSGVRAPEFPGRDLSALAAEAARPRFTLAAAARSASVTHARWHLILGLEGSPRAEADPGRIGYHEVVLYDLERDPKCEHDVSAEDFERAARLRDEIRAMEPSA